MENLRNELEDKSFTSEDDINFLNIFKTLFRRKKIIFIFALLSVLLSSFYALSKKRVWQGEFQIVLERNKMNAQKSFNPAIAALVGSKTGRKFLTSRLQTEVEILQSPYVLMSVFDYVKSRPSKSGTLNEDLRFKDWVENLDVKLSRGTRILNISYTDSDKDLIMDVLNKVSVNYQNYSKLEDDRDNELGSLFYKKQIALYMTKVKDSLKNLQEYETLNDLNYENSFFNSNINPTEINQNDKFISQVKNINIGSSYVKPLNIEILNATSKSNIKIINRYLKELNSLNNNDENILFIAEKISSNKKNLPLETLTTELNEINQEIDSKNVIYKDNDKTIKILKTQKDRLMKSLKNQAIGYLEESKKFEEANYDLSLRNNDVLLKYKSLRGELLRNKRVLDSLIDGAQTLSIENSKFEDPWKLITKPRLLNYPIAPKRKIIVIYGFAIGIIISCLIILLDEKRKGFIYYNDEIDKLVKWKNLAYFESQPQENFIEDIKVFKETRIDKIKENLPILIAGEVKNEILNDFNKYLSDEDLNNLLTKEFMASQKSKNLIVLIIMGNTKKSDILKLDNKIKISNKSVLGTIIIA